MQCMRRTRPTWRRRRSGPTRYGGAHPSGACMCAGVRVPARACLRTCLWCALFADRGPAWSVIANRAGRATGGQHRVQAGRWAWKYVPYESLCIHRAEIRRCVPWAGAAGGGARRQRGEGVCRARGGGVLGGERGSRRATAAHRGCRGACCCGTIREGAEGGRHACLAAVGCCTPAHRRARLSCAPAVGLRLGSPAAAAA